MHVKFEECTIGFKKVFLLKGENFCKKYEGVSLTKKQTYRIPIQKIKDIIPIKLFVR